MGALTSCSRAKSLWSGRLSWPVVPRWPRWLWLRWSLAQASRAKHEAQIKKVLNPAQYTKLMAIQAERMERGGMREGECSDVIK